MALAETQISQVSRTVLGKLATVTDWVNRTQTAAESTLANIGTVAPINVDIQFPAAPGLTPPVNTDIGSAPPVAEVLINPETVSFTPTGNISLKLGDPVPDPEYGVAKAVPDRPTGQVPVPPLDYPTTPTEALPPQPVLTGTVAPTITMPDAPTFIQINIPTIPQLTFEELGVSVPQLGTALASVSSVADRVDAILNNAAQRLNVTIDEYRMDNAEVAQLLQTKYLQAYEAHLDAHRKRLMDELASAVDREVVAKTEEVHTAWAAKNFSIAPGMLIDQVNELEIEGGRKLREQASKINQEIAKIATEDFKQELEFYVMLEQCLMDLHMEQVREVVELEKLRLRQQLDLFNATVELYNAKISAVSADVEAYNALISAQVEYSGAYKTIVDGAIAEVAENESRVQVYGSQVNLLKAQADVYNETIRASIAPLEAYRYTLVGVKANSDTVVANIEAYREAVRGYAAAVEAVSAEVEAYAAQVQAGASAAGVAQTNARAYATYIQEAVRQYSNYTTFAGEQSELLSTNIQAFRDVVGANESFLRAHAAKVSSEAEIVTAQVSGHEKAVRSVMAYNKAVADYHAAMTTHSMTSAENVARAQALDNQIAAETAKINAGAAAAKASALAGLAQGAMSALHVSASAQGSGMTNSSYSYSKNVTSNWGGTRRQSESRIQQIRV